MEKSIFCFGTCTEQTYLLSFGFDRVPNLFYVYINFAPYINVNEIHTHSPITSFTTTCFIKKPRIINQKLDTCNMIGKLSIINLNCCKVFRFPFTD